MFEPAPPLALDFSRYGNSAQYCRDGWLAPEATQTWTAGPVSALEVPTPELPGEYLLRFDLSPPPAVAAAVVRELTVLVNDIEVGHFVVRERVCLDCVVDWAVIASRETTRIEFHQPGEPLLEDAPPRSLGFATLILVRVGAANKVAVNPEGGHAALAPRTAALPLGAENAAPDPDRDGGIDLYGYSEQAGGWLVSFWSRYARPDGIPDTALLRPTDLRAHFEDGPVAAESVVTFPDRHDEGSDRLGFAALFRTAGARHGALVSVEIGDGVVGRQIFVTGSTQRLGPDETTDWVSKTLVSAETAAAVKAMLLEATVGRDVDSEYYLARYPDLRASNIPPARHYLSIGWRENRDPTPWFSTKDYTDLYSDILNGQNPFYHYITYGRKEGRQPHNRPPEWAVIAEEFDIEFYMSKNEDVVSVQLEPIQHYLQHGWREGRDPARWFSVKYYLARHPELATSGRDPFSYYIQYGRAARHKTLPTRLRPVSPLISVIVPNYNHEQFLAERLDAILQQTYRNIEIVILDDASTDGSRAIIERYRREWPDKIRVIYNEHNSGRVLQQWREGLRQVRGELVWICESDDSCERDFLATLVPYFADPSIMLAFGRIQVIDADGVESGWLDSYRESTGAVDWSKPTTMPTYEWFRSAFAVRNVIPNVGGCVFRNQVIPDPVWEEALSYSLLGDWFLYAQIAGGGRIAFDPKAVSYFRQHSGNTSRRVLATLDYFREHLPFGKMLRRRFGTSRDVMFRFYEILADQYVAQFGSREEFEKIVDLKEILAVERAVQHVVISIVAMQTGGAEVFAIHLANQLVELGYVVSLLCSCDLPYCDNEGMRRLVDPRIAIYDRDLIDEIGAENFLNDAGVDIISSHFIETEYLFLSKTRGQRKVPYVVTMHGSHETHDIKDGDLLAFLRGVDYWIYTARKNLNPFAGIPLATERLVFLPNALRIDDTPFPYTREALGADDDTLIFGIASRAIPEKGWEESIEAVRVAAAKCGRGVLLLLCGDGPELDRLMPLYGGDPHVRFLGFQPNIHGFYRLCDCCLLPSRFRGESYPLTIVQALQVGAPVIATDIAEIRAMLMTDGKSAGIILPATTRREALVAAIATAMVSMSDDAFRTVRQADARAIGSRYDIGELAQRYIEIFRKASGGRSEIARQPA